MGLEFEKVLEVNKRFCFNIICRVWVGSLDFWTDDTTSMVRNLVDGPSIGYSIAHRLCKTVKVNYMNLEPNMVFLIF